MIELTKTAEMTKTEKGVEARYLIALIHFMRGDYKSSQASCYEVINQTPSYEYWVVKSFILLADNHIEINEIFQAKATLQSIVENYSKDNELMEIAFNKLQLIIDRENREKLPRIVIDIKDTFIIENDSIYIQNDTIK